MNRVILSPAETVRLLLAFNGVRDSLAAKRDHPRLSRPVADWILSSDRGIPYALLERTLAEIIATPFEKLIAVPSIGPRKLSALIEVLQRAASEPPIAPPQSPESASAARSMSIPTEVTWERWRATIQCHNIEFLKLGRVALTLQDLPRTLWNVPLSQYLGCTVREVRDLPLHGNKRVRGVFAVFDALQQALTGAKPLEHLSLRFTPSRMAAVEAWISGALSPGEAPLRDEIEQQLVQRLCEQLELDAGEQAKCLFQSWLGTPSGQIGRLAQKLRATRARVYQRLDDVSSVFAVRWPEGKCYLSQLLNGLRAQQVNDERVGILLLLQKLICGELPKPKRLHQKPTQFG